ncbi:MAG: ATP-binding protein [Microcoleaceae cyanobacterium]
MITVSPRPAKRNWFTLSFASTLYLCPVLDLLLAEIPEKCQAEVRLGLQEALVNAAKHGNQLDPGKTIMVQFSVFKNQLWWIISDQGGGFRPPQRCGSPPSESNKVSDKASEFDEIPNIERECGRGLYILNQIFDKVEWNYYGTELSLCKELTEAYA